MLGTEIRKLNTAQSRQKARELLQAFKLGEFAERYPHQLSGGMRQRAALARTLAVDPSVLLLDEPFSAVDAQTRIMLQHDLAQTLKNAKKTALLITHDLLEAVILSDRVLVMSKRPGKHHRRNQDRHPQPRTAARSGAPIRRSQAISPA